MVPPGGESRGGLGDRDGGGRPTAKAHQGRDREAAVEVAAEEGGPREGLEEGGEDDPQLLPAQLVEGQPLAEQPTVGQALLGSKRNDKVKVSAPGGDTTMTVVSVR